MVEQARGHCAAGQGETRAGLPAGFVAEARGKLCRCFASALRSRCCTVPSRSLSTSRTALSPLCGGRFCRAGSHGVFLQKGL